MFRNNLIQPVNQFWFPERDVCGALLKVSDAEHLIFIVLFTLNRLDVVIQMNGDVFPVVGDRFAAETGAAFFPDRQVDRPVAR